MAKMDRDFLVPYLRDVCALHYALNRVSDARFNKSCKVDRLAREARPSKPSEPKYEPAPILSYIVLIVSVVGTIACALLMLVMFFYNPNFFTVIVGLFMGFLGFLCLGSWIEYAEKVSHINERNRDRKSSYEVACRMLGSDIKKWQERQDKLPALREELAFLTEEERKIRALLQKVYSVNVIPKQYRDFYTAVYLYDFFDTSYEDDISVALGLYALEQIKEKLDIIIENQSQMLLNQYTMIAEQQRAREEHESANRRLCAKLDSLQASSDEMVRSQRVIESNTDTIAFFAQANYLRNL